ncbi:MAG: hypothetical protein ABIE03_03405 [Patescibacteria group bacterium]|nr:transposase [Patescibacteria group bacterium]
MPSPRIAKNMTDGCYFLTFTVNHWVDIFTSYTYFDLLIDNLKFYTKQQKAKLYGYVFMTNHIHLIAQCSNTINFVRNYKSFTSKEIIQLLKTDNRRYLLPIFNNNLGGFNIWRSSNWPVYIESDYFFEEKLNYIG